ncbi:hypothetical protein F5X68DRAFT_249166 [Plectosphaerella plurivora]|uniref:Uncharacterized protein n=1 Tax=Plectosphaerella plurivora TaxID=936078 RepID=A0A9P8V313_9PEZI|nr:hypothetical protein F5X68DRAFT_249166 [Plectosphaerella plurivora]
MRFLEQLSDTLRTILNKLNCFTKPKSPSLQKALDAYYRNNSESKHNRTVDATDIKRLISYPRALDFMDPDTVWFKREQGQGPNRQPMCMNDMWPSEIKEMFIMLSIMLNGIPYKVCGLSALAAWGYTSRMPVFLTIACTEDSQRAILAWAEKAGMPSHPEHPDSFGIQVQDGTIRKIHIEAMSDFAFHSMDSTFHSPSNVPVNTLAAILDALAEIYVRNDLDEMRRAVLQDDIQWILRRIIAMDSIVHKLRRETCPHVWHPRFWPQFMIDRPDMRDFFHMATHVPDHPHHAPPPRVQTSSDLLPPPPPPRQTLRRVGRRRPL